MTTKDELFTDKDLLVLSSVYPDQTESFIGGIFIKNQIAELKEYFRRIIVIAPLFRSFGCFEKDKLCKDYTYDNVEVYYPRSVLPGIWPSKILMEDQLWVIERTIKKHHLHFDLVHAHFTWPPGYIGVRLKEKYRKPVIITIHESGDGFDQEVRMECPIITTAWSGADALIRVNRRDVPILKRYNERVHAIPNGFPPAFHPLDTIIARNRLDLLENSKIIFTLGNLIKRKGFDYLVDAMERVCSHRDDVICFIGGAGPERENLQGQIDQLRLGEKIKLLGSVPADQLNLWMNACDFFVLPSHSEGNPTVMFEALGCGKPFVGTKVGGVPEVISSNTYGLLVEPANPIDLAEKILMALDWEWDREAILEYAKRFTWENIAEETIGVYHALLLQGGVPIERID